MRILGEEVERKIYQREAARGWRRSGLIAAEQLSGIEAALGPLPTQGGWAIRLLLFGLTLVAAQGVVGFFTLLIGMDDRAVGSVWMLICAAVAYYLAERLIRQRNLYRFGAEEGLVVAGLIHLCAAILFLAGSRAGFSTFGFIVGSIGAAYSAWIYLRFGYLYAAYGAVAGLTLAAASQIDKWNDAEMRCLFAGLYALVLAACSARGEVSDHDRLGWQSLKAVLVLLITLFLNFSLDVGGKREGAIYWTSFLLILAIPGAAFAWGIRYRDRPILAVGFIGVLVWLVSIKPYFGYAHQPWNAAVLGAALMGGSLYLRKLLEKDRADGWTSKPVIVPRQDGPPVAGLLAASVSAEAAGAAPARVEGGFTGAGGSSGGAGASASF